MAEGVGWGNFQLVSLAVVTGLVLIRALLLWITIRVNAFKISQRSDLLFVVYMVLFVLLLLRTAQLVDVPLPDSVDTLIVNCETVRRAGASLVVVAILVFVLALLSFRNSWRVGIDTRTPGQLVTTGIFAFSRNPIFVFMDLYVAATFLLNGTLIFMLMAFAGIIGLHFQIRREERFLQQHYGKAYEGYRARTPRYFGRL